ncbi:hypothetical protein BT63DRAFT_123448 [Microthyrium microscopicum]|uniref:Uncharacterized protein n=1 Tax=Microthyrium microscopicum TaxID=703497 RepID=A0A6A6TWN0_9PEZI|nr:hypothetical protein BT63DRAFT_123448 [Microthyrium microscopicum]
MNRYFTKRRAKKVQPEPKFEVDLTSALPSSDNFRTSLMMDGFSKRFSLLREQDDPNSLMGKASDDSVLAPRRQSRMMGQFGFGGGMLDDIAEVSSISGSIRPPFASNGRAGSYISDTGYDTDDNSINGGVMNRARPGEGNILFGGRQKVYKIPTAGPASTSSLEGPNGMRGRALYDDDVHMSTFQRFRHDERERERLRKEDEPRARSGAEEDSPSKPQSPGLHDGINRHASTSTTSAPSIGRTSTAATSIASQVGALPTSTTTSPPALNSPSFATTSPPLERSTTKSRRLYDQVLTRDMEDQQTSAITRLNSIQKAKGRTSPPFSRTGSKQGGREPYRVPSSPTRMSPPATTQEYRPNFPLSDTPLPQPPAESQANLPRFGKNPLISAISPNDRGKATAMGAFNKPTQFSETQYLQRQMTLRRTQEQERNSRVGSGAPGTDSQPIQTQLDRPIVAATPLPEHIKQDEPKLSFDGSDSRSIYAQSSYSGRSRAGTNASATEAFSVFQKAANQMKASNANSHAVQPVQKDSPPQLAAIKQDASRTNFFFNSRDSSGSEYESQAPAFRLPPITPVQPSNASSGTAQSGHPAFRSRLNGASVSAKENMPMRQNPYGDKINETEEHQSRRPSQIDEAAASPNALGPANGGLSGLIHQHLRQHSASSSYYGDFDDVAPPVPQFPSKLALRTRDVSPPPMAKPTEAATPAESNYSHASNPFDLEGLKNSVDEVAAHYSPVSPVEENASNNQGESSPNARASRRRGYSRAADTTDDMPWNHEMPKMHGRAPSADTINEQDAFTSEIAKRRRDLQERLKARMDESPAPSPQPEDRFMPGPFRGLEMLRTKSSRESIKKGSEGTQANKPNKLFGLGASNGSFIQERPSFQSDRWRSEESSYAASIRSRSNSRPATSRSVAAKNYPVSNGFESGRSSDDYPPNARDRKGSNPPQVSAHNNSSRSRSNSQQSNGRSRSRNGRYKDDLEKAMVEGSSSRVTTQIYQDPPTIPEDSPPPMPPIDMAQRFAPDPTSNPLKIQTARSTPGNNSYFDAKPGLYPPPALHSPMSASSVTSSPRLPIPGSSALSPGMSPRPSPGFAPHNAMGRNSPAPFPNVSTPPLSGSSTPIAQTFSNSSAPSIASSSSRARSQSRKRSIQKHQIGEPRLISTTSVLDTVELSAAANLQHGMDDFQHGAPPVPPINPMRRKFGFNRGEEDVRDFSAPASYQQYGQSMHSGENGTPFKSRHRLRKSSSEGEKLGMRLRAQSQANASNPALRTARPVMEGGMF